MSGKMGGNMKENTKKIRKMDMENILGSTGGSMQGSGKMGNDMGKGKFTPKKEYNG